VPKVSENRGCVEAISAGERIRKEVREIGLVTHDDRVNLPNAPTVFQVLTAQKVHSRTKKQTLPAHTPITPENE